MSCITSRDEGSQNVDGLLEKIDEIIEESVEMMLNEATSKEAGSLMSMMDRAEPPFTPTTFTLWRKVAVLRMRKAIAKSH